MVECTLPMHVLCCDCLEFLDEIPFKEGRMLRPEKFQFLEKWQNLNFAYKIVISVKIRNLFSRYRMMKRISPLESSREIYVASQISSNSETYGIYTFFEASQFSCRKMIFDVTKVTYYTYSCAISGMSREMMKIES